MYRHVYNMYQYIYIDIKEFKCVCFHWARALGNNIKENIKWVPMHRKSFPLVSTCIFAIRKACLLCPFVLGTLLWARKNCNSKMGNRCFEIVKFSLWTGQQHWNLYFWTFVCWDCLCFFGWGTFEKVAWIMPSSIKHLWVLKAMGSKTVV